MNNVQTACKIQVLVHRNTLARWREAGESGTKQLFQPEPRPVAYIVTSRLPLVAVGDHGTGTIPAAMINRKKELFEYGKCDESARPGTGSTLYLVYYINSWAMCWPSYHAKTRSPLTGEGSSLH